MRNIQIKQIGNGGAFDTDQTNSSFLIKLVANEYMLFDCGYNVFSYIKENEEIEKIKTVYISHMDDDHIGSLKSFIYYQFFVNNIRLTIIVDDNLIGPMEEYLKDINGFIKYNQFHEYKLFKLFPVSNVEHIYFKFETFKTLHHTECYGLILKLIRNNNSTHDTVVISGDTKSIPFIMENIVNNDSLNVKKIYHDFSNWNEFHMQTHCCEYDFSWYSDKVKDLIIKYHNGEDFNREWVTY